MGRGVLVDLEAAMARLRSLVMSLVRNPPSYSRSAGGLIEGVAPGEGLLSSEAQHLPVCEARGKVSGREERKRTRTTHRGVEDGSEEIRCESKRLAEKHSLTAKGREVSSAFGSPLNLRSEQLTRFRPSRCPEGGCKERC